MMEAPLYLASSVLFFLRMILVKGWEFEWFSFSHSSVFGGIHSFQGLSAGVALPALQKLVLWWDCPKSMMRSYIGWIQNLLKWHWKCSSVFSWRAHFGRSALVVSAALPSSSSPRGELAAPPALPSPELDRESYLGWLKVLVSVLILSWPSLAKRKKQFWKGLIS